jgi:hypothetical protein
MAGMNIYNNNEEATSLVAGISERLEELRKVVSKDGVHYSEHRLL